MKTFLYVKTNRRNEAGKNLLDELVMYAIASGDDVFAIRVNKEHESLFQKDGTCPLFEFLKVLQIEKLLVYDVYELSLNPDEIIQFNYQLYQESIICELVLEQQILQEWVAYHKMYEDDPLLLQSREIVR